MSANRPPVSETVKQKFTGEAGCLACVFKEHSKSAGVAGHEAKEVTTGEGGRVQTQ